MNDPVYITVSDTGVTITVSQGAQGAPGVGVPAGGAAGTHLAKASATSYDTAWVPATPVPTVGDSPTDLGKWQALTGANSVALLLPGTSAQKYAWLAFKLEVANNKVVNITAGVDLGGVSIGAAEAGHYHRALCWRVA